VGRFIQADSIIPDPGNSQAWDRYAYTANNPVKYVDPSGHSYCDRPNADPEECGGTTEEEYQIYLQTHPLPQGMELPPELPEHVADNALMDAFVYLWNTPTGRAFAQLILDQNVSLHWAESGETSGTEHEKYFCSGNKVSCISIEITPDWGVDPAVNARDMAHEAVHVSMWGDENTQWQEYSAFRIESKVVSELNSQGWANLNIQFEFSDDPRPSEQYIQGWMKTYGYDKLWGQYPVYPNGMMP
jgi:hypothetical protein